MNEKLFIKKKSNEMSKRHQVFLALTLCLSRGEIRLKSNKLPHCRFTAETECHIGLKGDFTFVHFIYFQTIKFVKLKRMVSSIPNSVLNYIYMFRIFLFL